MAHRIIPAIMSGGAGTRLWPLSTESKPKQFHALMGARSLFAETAARVLAAVGEVSFAAPIVLCGETHAAPVRDALGEVSVAPAAIVIEPAPRNTAGVAAVAAALAHEIDPDALVLLLPSDHAIGDAGAFHAAVNRAAPFAYERIITFGMAPTYPATGYGYIKSGADLGDGVFAVEAFKEKPDQATARAYLNAGGYSWNAGIFLFNPATLLAEFGAHAAIRDHAIASLDQAARNGAEIRLSDAYARAPSLPIDVAVMEQTTRAAVIPCDLGWADIGSWAELWRRAPRGPGGFAVLGPAAAPDASRMEGVNTLVVDGDDLVIVAAPRGLIILPRARAQDDNALRDLDDKL